MTFAVRVDTTDPTPPYEQLRRQIADAISSGVLAEGTQLPTVRQLSSDLGVATGTVMRAYSELDGDGLLRTARGAGTIVAPVPKLSADEKGRRLRDAARAFVSGARLLGATDDQIVDAVRKCLPA